MPEDLPQLAGWRFHRKLKVTDFSDIWLAEDTALERAVAIKLFRPKADEDGIVPPFHVDEWRRRFLIEARQQARFDHPHIVPVVALDYLADGTPALVMQYMSGSLRSEAGADVVEPRTNQGEGQAQAPQDRPRALPAARVRQVLIETLAALSALHARQMVHRDVKPGNLLLTNGPGSRVKLTDFGMLRLPDEAPSAERVWIGTLDYISPEQYQDAHRVTDRADIFSVAMVGWRLLTGTLPDKAKPLEAPGHDEAFCDLLRRVLSSPPDQRPSAPEMIGRLAALRLPGLAGSRAAGA